MLPFSKKYKPKKIDDIILNDIIKIQLKSYIEQKETPNLILTGNTGVGKTSLIHCLIKELYHKDDIKNMIFEIKSTEGIDINKSLEIFCKNMVSSKKDFCCKKMIIIDESDNLMDKTQKLISSYYSEYSNISFVLTCNNLNDIIEGIQCDSVVFSLNDIDENKVIEKMKYICDKENMKYDEEGLYYLYKISHNDIRKIFNNLEIIKYSKQNVSIDSINECFGIPSNDEFEYFLKCIENKNIDEITNIIKQFNDDGYYPNDIMSYFIQFMILKKHKNDEFKIKLINHLSKKLFEVNAVSLNNYLQLSSCIYSFLIIE